jgi:5'-nucleotidase
MNRRNFIRHTAAAAAALAVPFPLEALVGGELTRLTILHTNDVHSRIDPFPDDHRRYPGMGGAAARSAIIKKIRSEADHLLLLDAGDMLQGTPYFNFYRGELEFRLMNEMQYDAATIGNHDFDAGLERLAELAGQAHFPLINCNYDFRDTAMQGKSVPFRIFRKGRLKIGITGVGIELDGLVPAKLFGDTVYLDPVENANRIAARLRHDERCDYVILLSHLGYSYKNRISDIELAERSSDIDLIIGGHTHTFLEEPVAVANAAGKQVMVAQVGWSGVYIGRLDILFHKKNRKNHLSGQTVIVDKKSIVI